MCDPKDGFLRTSCCIFEHDVEAGKVASTLSQLWKFIPSE